VGAAAPLQAAGIAAMGLPHDYYVKLAADYRARRDMLCGALDAAGFVVRPPDGAYYVMADYRALDPDVDDTTFTMRCIDEIGVAPVPGSSFYADRAKGAASRQVRFAFPKRLETLELAAERLAKLAG
jgi:aminotransferase